MDLLLLLRLAYLGAAALTLLIAVTPVFRDRFLAYGARAAPSEREPATSARSATVPLFSTLLDRLAALRMPHSWFTSFYAVSVACSLFWAGQICTHGPAFRAVVTATDRRDTTMTFRQILVTWMFMFVQGSRRLYECLAIAKPSSSQMWFGHWLLGLGFYVATSLALWVEGISALETHRFSFADVQFTGPGPRTFVSTILFILASGFQYDCHAYLASLPSPSTTSKTKSDGSTKTDYQLPDHPAFSALIAPHYTAECAIYLSLAWLAAPRGAWINETLLCAVVFVVVNLGVTAYGTKRWYEEKFGSEAVRGKWRMIPFVY